MSAQSFFGLDIGTYSIKAVFLTKEGPKYKLQAAGSIPTPIGGLSSGEEISISTVAEAIKKLVKDSRINTKNVNIALPESKIFTRVIEMPPISDDEIVSAIKWEAEQYIPLSLEDVNMDWQVLSRPVNPTQSSKMEILLSAAPKKIVGNYIKLAERADLQVISLEPQTTAIIRSFSIVSDNPLTTVILEVGAEESNLIIVKNGLMMFTRTISTGGNAITRAIVTKFGLEFIQAEEYKKTYGIEKDSFDGKLVEIILPIIDILVTEIKRAVTFYQSKKPDDVVKRLILSGSPSLIPGFVRHMTDVVGIETQIGDPWEIIGIDAKTFPDIAGKGPMYSVACGLAKKEIND